VRVHAGLTGLQRNLARSISAFRRLQPAAHAMLLSTTTYARSRARNTRTQYTAMRVSAPPTATANRASATVVSAPWASPAQVAAPAALSATTARAGIAGRTAAREMKSRRAATAARATSPVPQSRAAQNACDAASSLRQLSLKPLSQRDGVVNLCVPRRRALRCVVRLLVRGAMMQLYLLQRCLDRRRRQRQLPSPQSAAADCGYRVALVRVAVTVCRGRVPRGARSASTAWCWQVQRWRGVVRRRVGPRRHARSWCVPNGFACVVRARPLVTRGCVLAAPLCMQAYFDQPRVPCTRSGGPPCARTCRAGASPLVLCSRCSAGGL
jgi:hypothetical protein